MIPHGNRKHGRDEVQKQMEYEARSRYEMEEKKSDTRMITFCLVVALASILAVQIGFVLKVW